MLLNLLAMATLLSPNPAPNFRQWAKTPPMGWNSWDCFGSSVTEAEFRANVEVMAKELRDFGWEYATVDIQWYEPGAKGFDYRANVPLAMDEWGRLLPAPNRFPSAEKGKGFKVLADWVHSKGLKFGIHLMRGIPRNAVDQNLPIKGTKYRASDIADKVHICPWNPDMYGVDMGKPGAQEYYDSVFALIAEWKVDFVKVDDLSRPYLQNQPEVEAIRKAIDKTGRKMVLSLSPGETILSAAPHVVNHANMWRISDDFWDSWPALKEQFARLKNWNPFRVEGAWPDADMLPLGTLAHGSRTTKFTKDEQVTMMSLWAIARSPLILGADMRRLDAWTLSLLTNKDLIQLNQNSRDNRVILENENVVAWAAKDGASKDIFLAVFNLDDRYDLAKAVSKYKSEVVNRAKPTVEISANVEGAHSIALVVDDIGDGIMMDHAIWVEPRVEMADGSIVSLAKTPWKYATAGFGDVSTAFSASGKLVRVGGTRLEEFISAHSKSMVVFELPAGAKTFLATGALEDEAIAAKDGATVKFEVHAFAAGSDEPKPVDIDFALLGIKKGKVKDVWSGEPVATTGGSVLLTVKPHGCRLVRISP